MSAFTVGTNEHVREGAAQVVAPAGGTGAQAGCYDSAANRNTFIGLINAMRGALIRRGFLVGAAASNNFLAHTANENIEPGAAQVVAPAGGTGQLAGGYDSAANRNTCIDLINEIRQVLIQRGFMVGAAASNNFLAHTATEHVREGATQVVAPAGGTGGAVGGWDTAGNRDTAIALVNEMRTVLIQARIITGAA